MKITTIIKNIYLHTYWTANRIRKWASRTLYTIGTRRAWSLGYIEYRWHFIYQLLQKNDLLNAFRTNSPFKPYGIGLDERVVEYPWIFANLPQRDHCLLLDAGSALNFLMFIRLVKAQKRRLIIYTLAPERKCFWRESVSYHFGDLRDTPFKSELFDDIVCISTLEHIGMDNQHYGSKPVDSIRDGEFINAVTELVRILKTGGKLLITIPYGVSEYIEWGNSIFMRQFDAELLNILIQSQPNIQFQVSFFKYGSDGWHLSTQEECQDARYFNKHKHYRASDNAAAARAIVCLNGTKLSNN